jgi:hypothetical protein
MLPNPLRVRRRNLTTPRAIRTRRLNSGQVPASPPTGRRNTLKEYNDASGNDKHRVLVDYDHH